MMIVIKNILLSIQEFLGSYPVLFITYCIAFSFKIFVAGSLVFKLRSSKNSLAFKPWLLLILVLVSASISDFSWIIYMLKTLVIPSIDYRTTLFFVRLAWAFLAIQYQALALFMSSLLEKNYRLRLLDIPCIMVTSAIVIFFVGLAFYHFDCASTEEKYYIEMIVQKIDIAFVLANLSLSTLIFSIKLARSHTLPKILRKQLKIFIQLLIMPLLVSEFIQVYPFNFALTWITNNFAAATFTAILLTYTFYHCMRKIMGLRFLNSTKQVDISANFEFTKDFKSVLKELGLVTSTNEIHHIVKKFFHDAFNIPSNRTHFYVRHLDISSHFVLPHDQPKEVQIIENFLSTHKECFATYGELQEENIVVADELAFSNFYEEQEDYKKLLVFLNAINADIFIPIYENKTIVAYIIVERHARAGYSRHGHDLYSNAEQDHMQVFASYLGHIINLLQHRNLNALMQQEKELKEELFHKHQENNQYKECIRLFLNNAQEERKIGIMFYKNRMFSFGNQAAKEMIGFNINTHQGHPIAKTLKKLVQHVLDYNVPQVVCAHDVQGNKLICSAIFNLEQNTVIITTYYPEISDLIKRKIDLLKDPTKWDYLLYLETTTSGKLVNQLIPGSGQVLLNFKIDLLKIALNKKAVLLVMADGDLMPMVEIIHAISLREHIHTLSLQSSTKNTDIALKLFGINPLFSPEGASAIPLLEKLNNNGTLFIENIHHLDLETQEHLAEFIKYGIYKIFRSDKKAQSNVRIICSTPFNLQNLVQEGKFSALLFQELKATTITLPSLLTLSDDELDHLTTELAEQAIQTDTFKNLLELTDKEKQRIINTRPASIQELRTKIRHLLVTKSKKHLIYQETNINENTTINDPDIAEAARLGKHALKDSRMMALLWNKFNNQNKIATLLGVNRASVNRRCKEYNLN